MGKLDGKVALVTGAARGQGRSHALKLAEEGADVIAVDVCAQIDGVPYPMSTPEDLAETVKSVEALDRRIVAREADVRDYTHLESAVAEGIAELGRIDIVVANAAIGTMGPVWEITPEQWRQTVEVDLNGVFHTVRVALPAMMEQDQGGSLILISSNAGLAAFPNLAHYTAAKHGVTGLARSLAIELAPHHIRANSIHPTTVDTAMVHNTAFYELAGVETREQAAGVFINLNALPIPWIEPRDISNAVAWLASDDSRYVTGVALPIDAGGLMPYRIPHQVPVAGG
ncbi:mycofactocin-coupled SDR family oxidoreductase [Pseudonocardia oroxyli]|uniref:SDR family mycofactocin-dependent oxidoreductase n=1 Tax=Pseudonocardia oroxyli TaxID=366584 RepID=A0A1G7R2F3_PSEOR|nr:mycofactocin-coupled SDR family oxidoreductase [Pseudonocardia oroxyli]SDG04942.1 SDR family mycofactocin-dependent oxidoreductase [Pseudonocardia oroxyli]